MDFAYFLLSVVLGFLLSGTWFGFQFIITALIQKSKISWLSYFRAGLASVIPLFIIHLTLGIYPVQLSGFRELEVYAVAVISIGITAAIITRKRQTVQKQGKEILLYGFDGFMMEIPQRWMMQSFIYGILKTFGVSSLEVYTIIATGLVWCMAILMQALLFKKPFDKDMVVDIAASFGFSLGIGYVYQKTGFILITMIAHFCERVTSCYIKKKHV